MNTHEAFVQGVYRLVMERLGQDTPERAKLRQIKLVYGAGQSGLRGVTYFKRWQLKGADTATPRPFVEVCAFGQEHWVQVAGTTVHELAHVVAGWAAGHSAEWKAACNLLGLRKTKAAGMSYHLASFAPDLRLAIAALPRPDEGEPVGSVAGLPGGTVKTCGAGQGTRGGKSRGKGSGSRLRLWVCDCSPPVRVRVASDHFAAHCDCCEGAFEPR